MDAVLDETMDAAEPPHKPVKTTTVTGIVKDRDGITWINCGWKAVLVGYVGAPPIYIQDGTRVPTSFNGTVAPDGTFTGVLPANDTMTPPKTRWRITLFPLASCAPSTFDLSVTGATQNISTLITQSITPPRFKLVPGQFGYADLEVSPQPTAGTPSVAYANTTTGNLRIWNGTQFVDVTQGTLPANAMQLMPHINTGDCTVSGTLSSNKQLDVNLAPNLTQLRIDTLDTTAPSPHNVVRFAGLGPDSTHMAGFQFDGWSSDASVAQQYLLMCNDVPGSKTNARIYAWVQAQLAGGLLVQGSAQLVQSSTPVAPNSCKISNVGNITYIDSVGPDTATRAPLHFRTCASDGSLLLETLDIDANGNLAIAGHLQGLRVQGPTVVAGNLPNEVNITVPVASNAYFDISGADTATQGTMHFRTMNSNGSVYNETFIVQSTGISIAGNLNGCGQNAAGGYTVNGGGLSVCWNISNGSGETVFINNHGPVGGGFAWHNAAQGEVVTSASTRLMYLDQAGNLSCHGSINGTAKNFVIPHPLDEKKNLIHSCLEGPEHAVFYRGEDRTDSQGLCTINLPDYFEALTDEKGRTVLLTVIDTDTDAKNPIPMLAASRVKDGAFRVRSDIEYTSFYWEVKAVRKDIEPLEVELLQEKKAE